MRDIWFSRGCLGQLLSAQTFPLEKRQVPHSSKAPARQQCRQRKARKHLFAFG